MSIHAPLPSSLLSRPSLPGGSTTPTLPGGGSTLGWQSLTDYRVVVGHQVPIFLSGTTLKYKTLLPFHLSNVTACIGTTDAIVTNNTSACTGGQCCKLISGDSTQMPDGTSEMTLFTPAELAQYGFVGDTDPLAPYQPYRDTTDGAMPSFYLQLGYYHGPIHARVTRPAIGNTSGGNAYFISRSGYDVNALVNTFFDNLKTGNFTTTALRQGDLGLGRNISSYSQDGVAGTDVQHAIEGTSSGDTDVLGRSSRSVASAGDVTVMDALGFDRQIPATGDHTDIRSLASGNVTVSGAVTLADTRTIIIEHGDLIITGNIVNDASSSWAFIVKDGNIRIGSNVTDIAGIYLAMSGAILSDDGIQTPTQLRVDGTLYGNTSDLVDHRTYVRAQDGYDAVGVGVIVNYSNRAFTSPPPLLSRFLDQFSVERVAR